MPGANNIIIDPHGDMVILLKRPMYELGDPIELAKQDLDLPSSVMCADESAPLIPLMPNITV
jgi:hypothetical protein